METHKIIIIEDDYESGSILKKYFEENYFEVIHVVSGEEGVNVHKKEKPSIVLLDVKLPGISGFEVLKTIRERDILTPVIMITGSEFDIDSQVKGYDNGVTIYLQKPVAPQVLLAQIKSLLKPLETISFTLDTYTITIQNREVIINNETHTLRKSEIDVLTLLLRKMNFLVSRDEMKLLTGIADNKRSDNILDSTILAIRRILKNYPGIVIENIYRDGYKITTRDIQ